MKKIIFATMVAIAMLVGIQSVFAEQFIVPEVSTSDNQCYVLDLPAGATAEAPEYAAPWQAPEVTEIQNFYDCWDFDTWLFGDSHIFPVGSSTRITVVITNNDDSAISISIYLMEATGNDYVILTQDTIPAGVARPYDYQPVPSNVRRVKVQVPSGAEGSVCVTAI